MNDQETELMQKEILKCLMQENYKEAFKILAAMNENGDFRADSIIIHKIIAEKLIAEGKPDEADAVIDDFITTNDDAYLFMHMKVKMFIDTDRVQMAAEFMREIRDKYEQDPLYVYDCCEIAAHVKHYDDAIQIADAAIEACKDKSIRMMFLQEKANILCQMEQYDKAVPLWEEIFGSTGSLDAAGHLMAAALEKSDFPQLDDISSTIILKSQDDKDVPYYLAWYNKGIAQKNMGNKEEAIKAFETLRNEIEEMQGTDIYQALIPLGEGAEAELSGLKQT